MTLDIAKFIANSIETQAKIQHLDMQSKTVLTKDVPQSVMQLITDGYGEKYPLDADYISFFWGKLGKEELKSLFNVVDKALGKSANKLTQTDFKKLDLESQDSSDSSQDDASSDDGIDSQDVDDVDSEPANSSMQDDGEELDEDDSSDLPQTSYFFLKITVK